MKKILFCFALLASSSVLGENGPWKLEKNEGGIKVYTRTVEGEDIREFKALMTLNASRKTIAEIVVNINDYPNWYPDISIASILKKVSANEFHVYNVIDLPWPANDRDGVSKMTIVKDENSTTIKIKAISGVKAVDDDYIRITNSYGFWKLTTKGDQTEVHFQYFASPAGSLPDWMINMFIVDNPFKTFQLLKEKVGG